MDRSTEVVALVDRGAGTVGTTDESSWFDQLDFHRESVDALVLTALEAGDAAAVAHLGAMLWPYWTRRATDGGDWLERSGAAVERSSPPPSEEFGLLFYGAGLAAFRRGDNARCRALSQRSLDTGVEAHSALAQARGHIGLSRAAFRDHDWILGLEHARAAGRAAEASEDKRGVLMALHMEAEITRAAGDYSAAVPLYERLLRGDREAGDVRAEAMELYNLGSVLIQIGELDRAESCLRESLHLADGQGEEDQLAYTSLGLAGLAARRGDPATAGRLLGAVEVYFKAAQEVLDPAEQVELLSHRTAGESAGLAVFVAAYAAGRAMRVREAAAAYLDMR